MRMQFVLLHSPLVGPTTWRWVAGALSATGHDVTVPDLRTAALVGDPEAVITAAAAAVHAAWSAPVLVGHSGAGSILPSVAERLGGNRRRLVFVDAGLPPCEGRVTLGGPFLDSLRTLADDGVLPKWSTWWGEGVMQLLVPAAERRAALEAEMAEVPLAFFESSLDMPTRWCESPGSFVLLSESYRGDAERARALGWPTVERLGGHLDIVNDPDEIARTILELAS
jgi:pimeloyl-ACP methyl ester carboxylesterase